MKLKVDTLVTVPAAPPAAGPDRALDPPPLDPKRPAGVLEPAGAAVAALAVLELLLEVALTIPNAPPATARAVPATAIDLLSLLENMSEPVPIEFLGLRLLVREHASDP